MRVSWAVNRDEARDALAQGWAQCMERALPSASWLPIPNLGLRGAKRFLDEWDLDGIIFTGGGNLGQDPLRDETELALLDEALKHHLPVFGVNRGLLLFQTRFKGGLDHLPGHRNLEHKVHLSKLPFCSHPFREVMVNSFHAAGITRLAEGLVPFAVDSKGRVEGAYHEEHRLVGVMWSPERAGTPTEFDATLMQSFFRLDD